MVVSPTVATILESIPGFAADTDGDAAKMNYAFGVQKVGALNSRQKVYKNPYMTANTILLGYRGTQFLESGAVFAPYIPLIMTPLVYDPDTFVPRKGLLTRYAKKDGSSRILWKNQCSWFRYSIVSRINIFNKINPVFDRVFFYFSYV